MNSKKYIGMDVHKESISIAVMNGAGKIVMGKSDRDKSEPAVGQRSSNSITTLFTLPSGAKKVAKFYQ